MKWKIDGFLVGILGAVGLAFLFPQPGAHGGILQPALLTKIGVALIFFLHGLALSFQNLKAGTLRWPLHLIVQISTFVFFPLLGWIVFRGARAFLPADLNLGFFYLCALPSTVSSSVALTAAARGNVPVAVFNATLSSILGIFLTPILVSLVVQSSGQNLPLSHVMLDLVLWLLLPLAIGQLLRPFFGAWASAHKPLISRVDRGTILLLVYTSFCDSVEQNVWTKYGLGVVLITILGALLLFFLVFGSLSALCQKLGIAPADSTAVIFCGTKKTLASGVPMAHLIFSSHAELGLILLPIMLYHSLQLLICGWLAGRWARQNLENPL